MKPDRKDGVLQEEVGILVDKIRERGLDVRAGAAETLMALGNTIREWNGRVNLISRKDIERLVSYHFCDAASLLPVIGPGSRVDMLDVGGSNGLPGLVLAAISPWIEVTVCDSKRKREGFLKDACAVLEGRASYAIGRVDGAAFRAQNLERFDLIVARAVTRLRLLLRWCLPLVRPGGCVAAYKGSRSAEEVRQAGGYLWSHGAGLVMIIGSPFAADCNPLRQFVVVGKYAEEAGAWAKS